MRLNLTVELFARLKKHQQTIAAAESCTGGLMAVYLSDAPGSSHIFLGSIVAYTEVAKRKLLEIPRHIIDTHGVVSEEVAALMAEGARSQFGSHWALSTTGYSGPSGGTPEAPLGTVCLGVCGPNITITKKYMLKNISRTEHQEQSCALLIDLALQAIKN